MNGLLRFSRAIDRMNGAIGSVISWLVVVMILIGAFNAVARYLGRFTGWNLSSNAYLELQWYLFSLVFLLGAAWTLRENAHVRVDVLYSRLSARSQAWINTVGAVVFLLPFAVFGFVMSIETVVDSWKVLEGSPDPGGLPRYPLKTMIPVAFVLLFVQGLSELFKSMAVLRGVATVELGSGVTATAAEPSSEEDRDGR